MMVYTITKGLDLPIKGEPAQEIREGAEVRHVGLVADDYIGLKPSMLVQEGERVKLGQALFIDKKNPGVVFTAPASGVVKKIHRGAKRKFESLVIELDGDEAVFFEAVAGLPLQDIPKETGRQTLIDSGLWTSLRARPLGKVASIHATPNAIMVTAIDTNPLAADPDLIIAENKKNFLYGLEVLTTQFGVPVHLCVHSESRLGTVAVDGVRVSGFIGPHPAGLPSTHIHFLDPVTAKKEVWHLCYQDVIRIGHLFKEGTLSTRMIVAFGGESFQKPTLVRTRMGANLKELCTGELDSSQSFRLLSGSVLDGRADNEVTGFLGRYHRQVSSLIEGSGRSLFGWLAPGKDRFSATGLFLSSFLNKEKTLSFLTAVWGGRRAIFPLDVYQQVMPLDMIALSLLKSLAVGDTEKSQDLGCLELIEEDLALCSYVCPGKNEFGPLLREVLTQIEKEG